MTATVRMLAGFLLAAAASAASAATAQEQPPAPEQGKTAVALAVGLGELGGSVLVSVPGVTMLSEKIFDMLHSARDDRLAGICLSLILLFAATTAAATWLVQRWARPGADGGV